MLRLGSPEVIILVVVVILLFGVGRVGKLAAELGNGIRQFRASLAGNEDKPEDVAPKH